MTCHRRKMKIRAECRARYRGEEEPRALTLGDRRFAIVDVLDRWLAPDHHYSKVRPDDGTTYVLSYDTASDEWELAGPMAEERRPSVGENPPHIDARIVLPEQAATRCSPAAIQALAMTDRAR